jgi:hypothetical protein
MSGWDDLFIFFGSDSRHSSPPRLETTETVDSNQNPAPFSPSLDLFEKASSRSCRTVVGFLIPWDVFGSQRCWHG